MKKTIMLVIISPLIFEPLFFSSTLASRYRNIECPVRGGGPRKKQLKAFQSHLSTDAHLPQTRARRKKVLREQKTTVNNTCVLLAGMIIVLPIAGLVASMFSWS